MEEYLIYAIVIAIVGLFIIRTGKRPRACTCKHYNSITMGPVDDCEAHKHMAEDDTGWYKGGHYPFS